ncbi:MAG: class II glutamine amidotransferase [Planctomycetia bacterium]|nr:class II glutamine amidotransferase [Planctomycetia bacterium]
MCRFALYLGPPITVDMLITRPAHSIIRQSFKSHLSVEPLNGDGFGVAWYRPDISPEPAAYRSVRPAWNNRNLRDLARLTQSGAILAHVRAASPGSDVSEANCHPFTAGRFAFMHNGSVAEFARRRRTFQQALSNDAFARMRGTTDSEHIFALWQDIVGDLQAPRTPQALADALSATIGAVLELTEPAETSGAMVLNLAVSDGHSAAVSRFATAPTAGPSLFWHVGSQYVFEPDATGKEACHMRQSNADYGAVIVASEPLTDEPGWQAVPPNHLLLVTPGEPPRLSPLGGAVSGGEL